MGDEKQECTEEGYATLSVLDVKLLAINFLIQHKEESEPAPDKDREHALLITASEDDPDDNEKRRKALIAAERILGNKGDFVYEL